MPRPSTIAEIRQIDTIPAVIINEQGLIQFVNAKFEALFGWTSAEVAGQSISIIIPEAMRDAHNLGFSRFITTGQPRVLNQPLALAAVNRSGEEFMAEHYMIAERIDDHWVVAATIERIDH